MSENLSPQFNYETRSFELMRSKLGDSGMKLLDRQLHIWSELNERQLDSPLRDSLRRGDARLPKGTLLHRLGRYGFDAAAVQNVARYGILSGDLIGITEDAETHGCADFFKVPADTTIEDYFAYAKQIVQEGPVRKQRGERMLVRGITLIVDPQAEGIGRLLEHDGYTDESMSNFVQPPYGRTSEDTAAILGGIPNGAIAGIVVSDKLLLQPQVSEALRGGFPDTPILTQDGTLQ